MLKIGITGGIGSGKSTVCRVFSVMGIPVFEADKVARKLMDTDEEIHEKLVRLFGAAVYLPDQTVNRKYLAGIVFKDPSLLAKLNEIVHPVVRKTFFDWCERQKSPYIIHEAAILFESGFYKMMDKTITVVTNEDERIHRVMKRDGITIELVKERIKNQWSDEERMKLADFVIGNNDDQLIIPQIIEIDKKIKANG
ncbi:dephospho-CoA kinase [Aquipluma nitroreducens]|uniref:Dephospho-CoA kinase n=1 Tax=Aquipluma nitroreducens TaxID=2010828 RepID=A0A5K7S5H5_9BACT|nr:dephospho-CoA kinase [Aquipluma nitroreducens]BBE16811.1 dephospho-CoA kinase [Aquipluma nitroreducens]